MIIGITGTNASGKGEAAEILKKLGYRYYSLSDMIREEAASRNEQPTRENLIRIGNEFRIKYGDGIWAKRLAEKLRHEEHDKIIVDSIRHPMEINELKKALGVKKSDKGNKRFLLLSIDAPLELRFQRAIKRARPGDPKTAADFEDFKKKEDLEKTTAKNVQQLSEAMKLADYAIINKGSIKELEDKLLDILRDIGE